jgi:RNA polymerase sigma-70 factor (ECF subfamily)
VTRLNRIVALAEVEGADQALADLASLDSERLGEFLPYRAVRAELFRRSGDTEAARSEYDVALSLGPSKAEAAWLQAQAMSL